MKNQENTPGLFPQEQPNSPSGQPLRQPAMEPVPPSSVVPLKPLTTSQYSKLGVSPAWCEKNPTFRHVCTNYGPLNWSRFTASPADAFAWTCPRVAQLDDLFAPECASAWVLAQLAAIYPVVTRNPSDPMALQVVQFSSLFASLAGGLKLTEVMRFLSLVYAGHYKNDYVHLDVTRIGRIFHAEYLPERRRYLDRTREAAEQQRARTDRGRGRYTTEQEWRAMPETHPVRLVVEIFARPGSPLERHIADYFSLSLPLAERVVEVGTTKRGLDQVIAWDKLGALKVHDSWH